MLIDYSAPKVHTSLFSQSSVENTIESDAAKIAGQTINLAEMAAKTTPENDNLQAEELAVVHEIVETELVQTREEAFAMA